jgi:hypothetical protein
MYGRSALRIIFVLSIYIKSDLSVSHFLQHNANKQTILTFTPQGKHGL